MAEAPKTAPWSSRGCAAIIGVCSAGLLVLAYIHWQKEGWTWRVVFDGVLAVAGLAFMVDVLAGGPHRRKDEPKG